MVRLFLATAHQYTLLQDGIIWLLARKTLLFVVEILDIFIRKDGIITHSIIVAWLTINLKKEHCTTTYQTLQSCLDKCCGHYIAGPPVLRPCHGKAYNTLSPVWIKQVGYSRHGVTRLVMRVIQLMMTKIRKWL